MNNHSKHGKTDVFTRWAFLSAYCRDLGRIDDIFLYSPCSDDLLPGSLYHLSELQLCPLVLKEEVDKFISQENKVPLGGGKLASIEKTI
ncbi:hypothetical protein, conserved [Angomonas deanei]|uniref:Uncharacterized protein n=1 Tax=Angomonas deanei TaxID=59799 RepID=A0A7G2C8P4_9TRYP|nr:hypothetical protein, conserved [Angomonas deanei]